MEGIEQSQFARVRVRAGLTTGVVVSGGLALAAGLALRILMLKWIFEVNGDSLIYGGIARNLLLHGRYALTAPNGEIYPTLIRLPGYPMFLVVCFRLFGMENYWAAACVQVFLDLIGCVLLADFARRAARMVRGSDAVFARRAGLAALWLAALCPFTAAYTAEPMAEAPTLFMLALAMWAMARFRERPGWPSALAFTFAVTYAALLRPDGVLAVIVFAPVMLMALRCASGNGVLGRKKIIRIAVICALLSAAPFVLWTARNWRVFRVVEPLAPRLATDPGENTNPGWERWIKSWSLDFVSTCQIYWNVPDGPLDVSQLPSRAFDSTAQYAETASIADEYNTTGQKLTSAIDASFAKLADERIAAHPFRYYVLLPLGRVADMWLRPRIENLPIDIDWWVYANHRAETRFSWFYAGLNALYLLLAAIGLCLRPRYWKALLAYMLLRSALLLTVEAPEARYTLECFPMVFALGGVAVAAAMRRISIMAGFTRPSAHPAPAQ
jgi:Dolichyl-phosphate-mannose-protein mannosyltransferase